MMNSWRNKGSSMHKVAEKLVNKSLATENNDTYKIGLSLWKHQLKREASH